MSAKERSYYVAWLCTELVQDGNDFPTVWNTVLKEHPLVGDDISHSKPEGMRPLLEFPLVTGERLVFDRDRNKFRVK